MIFKKYQSALTIFILMAANKFIPVISGNQEQYLGQAKQYFNPNWIAGSFSLSEPTGPRLIFDYLLGFLLNQFNFETVAYFTTLLNMFLLAFPLARLSEKFGLKNLMLVLWWQIIMLSSIGFGSFFGGEWFIGEIEPKTLAYVGALWGLVFYFEDKFILTSIAFGLGALFHPLASGWTFAVVCLNQLFKRNIKTTIQMVLIFILINLPLIFYYLPGVLLEGPKEVNGVATSWIYTYFRVPHHTAPFLSQDFFLKKFFQGIIKIIALVSFYQLIKKRLNNPFHQKVIRYITLNALMLSFFLGVAFFDRQGDFLKFYLFRSVSTMQLLSFLLLFGVISSLLFPKLERFKKVALLLVSILALFKFGSVLYGNYYKTPLKSFVQEEKMQDLYNFAKSSPKGSVFANVDINLAKPDSPFDAFARKTQRDIYVNFKFLPSNGKKLGEWYRRILVIKNQKFNNEKIDYLISYRDFPQLNKVFQSKAGFKVYTF